MMETCLFDMGNVVVLFSHRKMCRQIGALCGQSEEQMRRVLFEENLQLDLECGRIDEQEFHRRLEEAVRQKIGFSALQRAACDIFRPHPLIETVLEQLRSAGIRLVLLSNTCRAHFEWVRDHYGVLDRFHEFILSYEVGELKPGNAMYEAALQRIGCPPERCFYTDDIPENVEAGRRFGLQAELFTDVSTLKRQLSRQGVFPAESG